MLTDFAALRHVYFFQARSHRQVCFFCTPCSTCNKKDDMKEKENGNTIEHKTGGKKKQNTSAGLIIYHMPSKPVTTCVKSLLCKGYLCPLLLLHLVAAHPRLPLWHDWRPGPNLRSFTTSQEIVGHFYALPPGRCPEQSCVSGDYLAPVGGAELPEGHCGKGAHSPAVTPADLIKSDKSELNRPILGLQIE